MKIVADRDIFQVESCFSPHGELVLLPGREITAAHVSDADALLVRTVTRINADLVQGSALRFIGSATSGIDHVDMSCLGNGDIHFCHAPGCNADAVVNFVVASLAWLTQQDGTDWRDKSVGIIGAGNVGGRLANILLALGMGVLVYDPMLASSHPLANCLTTLEQVLAQDVVTLHVPLSGSGPYQTWHMLDAENLSLLKSGAILINTARGDVIDNAQLYRFMASRRDLKVVLDVWEHEPLISKALAAEIAIATPHIAGYSLNGKRNGTNMVYREFCRVFGMEATQATPDQPDLTLDIPAPDIEFDQINKVILQAYPINRDFLDCSQKNLAEHFDSRRNNYKFREEFGDYRFSAGRYAPKLVADLEALGFNQV